MAAIVLAADTVTLEQRVDLFDPATGAFMGTERTWFDPDGRRLRLEITAELGAPVLLFFLRHDERGRESEAIYFEGGSAEPSREVFTYSADESLKTTTYYSEPGVAGERTEADLDATGREIRKRYYRADGTQYGEEDVLWDERGNQLGWDFRYVGREGGASFRYRYQKFDAEGEWVRRIRSRDGVAERLEVRSRITASVETKFPNAAPFAPGVINTERSETSPSFSGDGKTMVFARNGDDWTRKEPFIGYLEPKGWRVEPLAQLGPVYNLTISPDASTLFFATRSDDDARALFRVRREGDGWSSPENLSERYGLVGTYPCVTEQGDLFFFDADGAAGSGIYVAARDGDGFTMAEPVFVPSSDAPFDGYTSAGSSTLLVTRCFDEVCLSGPENGIWEVQLDGSGSPKARKLPNLPYAWGVQPVESLGIFVFTDGDDILAVPLALAGLGR